MYDGSPDPSIPLKFRWSRRVRKPIVQDLKTGCQLRASARGSEKRHRLASASGNVVEDA